MGFDDIRRIQTRLEINSDDWKFKIDDLQDPQPAFQRLYFGHTSGLWNTEHENLGRLLWLESIALCNQNRVVSYQISS